MQTIIRPVRSIAQSAPANARACRDRKMTSSTHPYSALRILALLSVVFTLGSTELTSADSPDEFNRARQEAKELSRKRDYAAAAARFEDLLSRKESHFGKDSVELAADLIDLGELYGR